AQPGIQRYAHVRRKAARIRSDNQIARVRGIHHVKAHPVVAREFLMQPLGDVPHHRLRRWSGFGKALKFLQQLILCRRHAWDLASRVFELMKSCLPMPSVYTAFPLTRDIFPAKFPVWKILLSERHERAEKNPTGF